MPRIQMFELSTNDTIKLLTREPLFFLLVVLLFGLGRKPKSSLPNILLSLTQMVIEILLSLDTTG